MTEYISVQEAYRLNSERHLANAISYASAGYPDRFYDGSMRKAVRNLNISDKFKCYVYVSQYVLCCNVANDIMNRN